jgi:hypothetical protein
MGSNNRLNTIRYLLNTALDSEEEYLYEGEMSYYVRTYAGDAASELSWLFRGSPPTAEEVDLCVKAISDPERIERGRSKQLLLQLRESSHPILDALAGSPDPRLRTFALETGRTSLNPYFPDPLYGSIELNQRLLNDPDENVRAIALSTAVPSIVHNARYLEASIERGDSNPLLGFLAETLARLDDSSHRVREEAANVLVHWAAEVSEKALETLLERENKPTAREVLGRARASGDAAIEGDQQPV